MKKLTLLLSILMLTVAITATSSASDRPLKVPNSPIYVDAQGNKYIYFMGEYIKIGKGNGFADSIEREWPGNCPEEPDTYNRFCEDYSTYGENDEGS